MVWLETPEYADISWAVCRADGRDAADCVAERSFGAQVTCLCAVLLMHLPGDLFCTWFSLMEVIDVPGAHF